MSRGRSRKKTQGSERTCIGCRKVKPPGALVRLALAPEGVVADRDRRLPGRGAWVCPDPLCVKRAARHVVRALRLPPVQVHPDELGRIVFGQAQNG